MEEYFSITEIVSSYTVGPTIILALDSFLPTHFFAFKRISQLLCLGGIQTPHPGCLSR
jgi:hypothetical protein